MAENIYPLLFFPTPASAERSKQGGGGVQIRTPGMGRQRSRIAPQLAALRRAVEAKRIQVQGTAPVENPEFVLVLEVVGSVDAFATAVRKVAGLEWLFEVAEDQIEPDEDFGFEQEQRPGKLLEGRLYLLGTNYEALQQLLSLWERYQKDPSAKLDRGLAPFKHVFARLRAIRPWGPEDRITQDVLTYWEDHIASGQAAVRFEVEVWYSTSAPKNKAARDEIEKLVSLLNGRVLARTSIAEVAYHGFLVELPASSIKEIMKGKTDLLASDRIMFFRPKAQSVANVYEEVSGPSVESRPSVADRPPLIALLDGLPLSNHALLANRLLIDDPDGRESNYQVRDRVHGTAMASLILHGDLSASADPLDQKLYVRPVLQPDPNDPHRREQTPDDVLLIDLIHRSVKRIFEGEADIPPAAPTIRVVNLSLGDSKRIFSGQMSPWARLIDWLAYRFKVLFVVSSGNHHAQLNLETPRETLRSLTPGERQSLALAALCKESIDRQLMSPAESINALTVGALHADQSQPNLAPNRFDLFVQNGISPFSRVGHGYRRAIKPDVLMPGGRILYVEDVTSPRSSSTMSPILAGSPPGHLTAAPPTSGQSLHATTYSRGTSNAAALATRAAAQAHRVLELLRLQNSDAPAQQYDAVILKALLAHGATWGDLSSPLLEEHGKRAHLIDSKILKKLQKEFLARWLGYGAVDIDRVITCTAQRATLLGVGELESEQALIFTAPLPPSLAGLKVHRRLTVTLAWLSPINPAHQGYRRAKLWITPPHEKLGVHRENTADDKAAKRGTIQHEILEGDAALAFVDGDRFECKVNCAADAGTFEDKIAFALCVSLEVGIESGISIYEEIRDRIVPSVRVQVAQS